MELEKGFRGDPTSLQKSLALLFPCYVSFIFYILINIQKEQKHANNQKFTKIFFQINLGFFNQVIPFFSFFSLINFKSTLIIFELFSFSIKKTQTNTFCHFGFYPLKPFSKLIKQNTKTNQSVFLPRTTRF